MSRLTYILGLAYFVAILSFCSMGAVLRPKAPMGAVFRPGFYGGRFQILWGPNYYLS